MGTAVDDLQRVAGQLQRVSAGIWWDRLKEWLSAALIGLGLIFAAALAYQAPVHCRDTDSRSATTPGVANYLRRFSMPSSRHIPVTSLVALGSFASSWILSRSSICCRPPASRAWPGPG